MNKKIYSSKIVKRSGRSYCVNIPKQYVVDGSLKLGDTVLIVLEKVPTGIKI